LLLVLPVLKAKPRQKLPSFEAMLVMLIRLIRIALGAHYLRDVIAAIVLGSLWLMIRALSC
jgi:membrane-associated phospholipid phosphatase